MCHISRLPLIDSFFLEICRPACLWYRARPPSVHTKDTLCRVHALSGSACMTTRWLETLCKDDEFIQSCCCGALVGSGLFPQEIGVPYVPLCIQDSSGAFVFMLSSCFRSRLAAPDIALHVPRQNSTLWNSPVSPPFLMSLSLTSQPRTPRTPHHFLNSQLAWTSACHWARQTTIDRVCAEVQYSSKSSRTDQWGEGKVAGGGGVCVLWLKREPMSKFFVW